MLKEKISRKIKDLTASHILSLVFLCYICYVGFAAIPHFLINTGNEFIWGFSPQDFIRTTDEQYSGMLLMDQDTPTLQNKASYINLNGLMASYLDQVEMNDRIKLTNGHLASIVAEPSDEALIRQTAENITSLSRKQTEKGKHFLFVLVPSQISKYEALLPEGYVDTTNDDADKLLSLLDQNDVTYLDLREKMYEEGLSITDSYYITDHHWLPQTGFWAYTKILEKLESMEAISPVDSFYTDSNNFSFVPYKNSFLGSSGKRTGVYFAGVDDTYMIVPNFPTNISVTIDSKNVSLHGAYEDVSYDTNAQIDFENPDYFNSNAYGLYGWGDNDYTQWRNTAAPEKKKFLLIGESFGNVPFSLLSLYLSSCDELDMRYYDDDFADYYSEYDPDTIILEVSIGLANGPITNYPFFHE